MMKHPESVLRETGDFYAGPWLVRPSLNQLVQNGTTHRVPPRFMQVLQCLAAQPGKVVNRGALLDEVWEGVYVDDVALSQAISHLRKVLGDDPKHPRFIETIPKRGYRLIAPVAPAMPPAVPTSLPAEATPRTKKHWLSAGVALAVLVSALGLLASWFLPLGAPSAAATLLVTTLQGEERDPALSPDGQAVAFAWEEDLSNGDNYNLYVKHLNAPTPVQLTASGADDRRPTWAPDGQALAFIRLYRGQCGLFVMTLAERREQKLTNCAATNGDLPTLAWSPDGTWLAYTDRASALEPYRIFLFSIATNERRVLTSPALSTFGDYFLAFSPDGKQLAFSRTGTSVHHSQIHVIAIQDEKTRLLIDGPQYISGLTWVGKHLIFSSKREGKQGLWRVPVSGGTPEWLGYENARMPSASSKEPALVYVKASYEVNIWRVANSTVEASTSSPVPFLQSTQWDANIDVSPDGSRTVFVSTRTGQSELWMTDQTGTNAVQLTAFGENAVKHPRWSPEGHEIAFEVHADTGYQLWVIDAEHREQRLLVEGTDWHVAPNWSRDGRWVYFGSRRGWMMQIWKVAREGGEPVLVTQEGGYMAIESPEGGYLYYVRPETRPCIWRRPLAGGPESCVVRTLYSSDWRSWTIQENGLYFFQRFSQEGPVIGFFDFATEEISYVATIAKEVPPSSGLTISPDERWIYYSQMDKREGDIVLLQL